MSSGAEILHRDGAFSPTRPGILTHSTGHSCPLDGAFSPSRRGEMGQKVALIIPAPTVTPVASSISTNDPVVRFLS